MVHIKTNANYREVLMIGSFFRGGTKTAAKPPAERSGANKVYIYLYTGAKPPVERSEANKVYIFLYTASEARLIKSIYLLMHGGVLIFD